MESGIYGIYSKSTGKWYVGQAQDIEYRFYQHRYLLKRGKDNAHLRHAYEKYGADDFEFSVLEYCPVDMLNEREIFWVAEKNAFYSGFNFTLGGGGNRGWKASPKARQLHSELTRAQWSDPEIRSKRLSGMSSAMSTPAYRLKLSDASRKNWSMSGYRERMKEVVRGAWADPALREKRLDSLNKVLKSEEYRCKMHLRTSDLWRDPKYREKTNSARNAAMQSVAYRAGQKAHSIAVWNKDRDYAARCLKGLAHAHELIRVPVLQVETGTVYPSATEAASAIGVSGHAHISQACSGKRVSAHGFHWRYAPESLEDWRRRRKEYLASLKESGGRGFRERPVVCLETNAVFPSAKSAADFAGIDPSNITKVCKNAQASAGGYHWQYADAP